VDTSMFKWTDDTGPVDIQSKTALWQEPPRLAE
jgi:hypothetical protein